MRTRPTPPCSTPGRRLLAGFTTVRDLGGDPRLILSACAMRSMPASFAGPTIVAAGAAWSRCRAAMATRATAVNRDLASLRRQPRQHLQRRRRLPPRGARADQRRRRRDQVRRDRRRAVSNVPGGLNQQMMDDEMRAVVDHRADLRPQGRRPRPRRRGRQRRASRRGRFDRAWHLHQRRDLPPLQADRRLLRPDPARPRRGARRRRSAAR